MNVVIETIKQIDIGGRKFPFYGPITDEAFEDHVWLEIDRAGRLYDALTAEGVESSHAVRIISCVVPQIVYREEL